ncbi:MAG: hypothetical protein ACREJN_21715, partial [Nitrospiraceae bacterium]
PVVIMMGNVTRIDWIHPSCRDLVIEELASEPRLEKRFVEGMSLQGIKLAISGTGGASGERQLPLMNKATNWDILSERCLILAKEASEHKICDLLTALSSACRESSDPWKNNWLKKIISSVCTAVCDRWNTSDDTISSVTLETYCNASILAIPFPPVPNLNTSWINLLQNMRDALLVAEDGDLVDPERVLDWAKFASVVRDNEPRFLRVVGFPSKLRGDISRLIVVFGQEAEADVVLDSAGACDEEANRIESLEEAIHILQSLILIGDNKKVLRGDDDLKIAETEFNDLKDSLLELSRRLRARVEYLQQTSSEMTPPEPDYDGEGIRLGGEEAFDVDGLFSDL